jgi:hypothetical protein
MTTRSDAPPARLARASVALLILLSAARCTPTLTPYQLGQQDGCDTGYSDAGRPGYEAVFARDDSLFSGNEDYRRGWIEAEKACYAAEMNFPTMTNIVR